MIYFPHFGSYEKVYTIHLIQYINDFHLSLLFIEALHYLTVNKSTCLVLESHKHGQEFLMFAEDP